MNIPLKKSWHHYLIVASALFGAASACSRWTWLDNGNNAGMKALGLHFFEGWLVFFLLGMCAGMALVKPAPGRGLVKVMTLGALLALMIALEFLFSNGIANACNALWFSISGAALASIASIMLWIRWSKSISTSMNLCKPS